MGSTSSTSGGAVNSLAATLSSALPKTSTATLQPSNNGQLSSAQTAGADYGDSSTFQQNAAATNQSTYSSLDDATKNSIGADIFTTDPTQAQAGEAQLSNSQKNADPNWQPISGVDPNMAKQDSTGNVWVAYTAGNGATEWKNVGSMDTVKNASFASGGSQAQDFTTDAAEFGDTFNLANNRVNGDTNTEDINIFGNEEGTFLGNVNRTQQALAAAAAAPAAPAGPSAAQIAADNAANAAAQSQAGNIAALQGQIASGNSAALQSGQQQAQAGEQAIANQFGAATTSGDVNDLSHALGFAQAGGVQKGATAIDQGEATAMSNDRSQLTSALGTQVNDIQAATAANVQQEVSNMGDLLSSLNTAAANGTAQQQQQIKDQTDQLTNLLQQYQTQIQQNSADAQGTWDTIKNVMGAIGPIIGAIALL